MTAGTPTMAMPPKALLLDMDGVMAEVSRSYRQAIVYTAAQFGVTVTQDDIEEQKVLGNANNDWVLTHRLIREKLSPGSTLPSLEEVTSTFENLYQGTQDQPGLCLLETLITTKGLLEELRRRLPQGMAVVTGRPRKDCDAFLEAHGIKDLFSVCVCMEDGPPKPSPKPIEMALCKLGGVRAQDAVMIGDTVDDVIAAVEAGVTAFGVLTPGDHAQAVLAHEESEMKVILMEHGAARVLTPGLSELLDIIPPAPSATPGPTSFSGASSVTIKRKAFISRVTKETSIQVQLDLDGTGACKINSGIGFLDHMLTALAKHSRFNIDLECKGDTWIDDHHTTEDCALTLGEAFDQALGNRAGIARFGSAMVPLDEALSRAIVDISSRAHSDINLQLVRPMIGTLSSEMITHFFESFASAARLTLHVDVLKGRNDHHRAEASFKALAVALRAAVARDESAGVPSTKGVLA